MMRLQHRAVRWLPLLVAAAVAGGPAAAEEAKAPAKIPVTAKSDEARTLYLQGRDLAEKLRGTDARGYFEKAVAKDADFALAHLGLANTAPSNKAFFDALDQAVALAGKVSEPERHMILGFNAGVRSDPAQQQAHYEKLVAAYPRDERAFNLLGTYHFGRQEYEQAIAAYEKALAAAPGFSPVYNQLGYAYRFLGRYDEAEKTFKKYTELIPDDPNPHDSYAELLMKRGRFDESIRSYERALQADPNFVASYVGIGVNQIYLGQPAKARETFARLEKAARTSGERRQALANAARSYVHEGAWDEALASIGKMSAAAEAGDKATLAGDASFMGNVLLEAGRADEAAAKFARGRELMKEADVPAEVKAAAERNYLASEARLALAKGDLATARARALAYAEAAAERKVPFEVRQSHEIAGLLALQAKDYAKAAAELEQANQQDPRVLFHKARAYQGKGDAAAAKEACRQAAENHTLAFNNAYVRDKARKLLATL